jgi:hypothetical protein
MKALGGRGSIAPTHLRAGSALPIPIAQKAGWAPEPVWTQGLEEKSFALAGDRTSIAHPVTRHYTDWATRLLAHIIECGITGHEGKRSWPNISGHLPGVTENYERYGSRCLQGWDRVNVDLSLTETTPGLALVPCGAYCPSHTQVKTWSNIATVRTSWRHLPHRSLQCPRRKPCCWCTGSTGLRDLKPEILVRRTGYTCVTHYKTLRHQTNIPLCQLKTLLRDWVVNPPASY